MPRILETPAGMLNAIGLQNPGHPGLRQEVPADVGITWTVPAIVNISAEAVADYADDGARSWTKIPAIAGIEVNVSCPNIARGGYCFGWDPEMTADVTRAVRQPPRCRSS